MNVASEISRNGRFEGRSGAGRQTWKQLSWGEISWDGEVDRGGERKSVSQISRLRHRLWGPGAEESQVREHASVRSSQEIQQGWTVQGLVGKVRSSMFIVRPL